MSTFSVMVDTAGLDALMNAAAGAAKDAVRPAAQAGAQVFYDEARRLVPKSKKGHWFHGTSFKLNGKKYWYDAGSLQRAIYQVYSKDSSGPSKSVYQIAWNHQKVPYGFMVEFGTSKAAAHPFIRGARDNKAEQVRTAIRERFIEELRTHGAIT